LAEGHAVYGFIADRTIQAGLYLPVQVFGRRGFFHVSISRWRRIRAANCVVWTGTLLAERVTVFAGAV